MNSYKHRRQAAQRLLAESLNAVSTDTGIARSTLREWRDRGLEPRTAAAACWVCEGLAPVSSPEYAALLGFYLGDGCLSVMRSVFALRVSCDRSYPGIIEDVSAVIARVHPGSSTCLVDALGVRVVTNCWKHWARREVAGVMKRCDYPRWQSVFNSDDIRGFCTDALDLVGVPWRQSSSKTLSVSTRAGVARLDELIGLKG